MILIFIIFIWFIFFYWFTTQICKKENFFILVPKVVKLFQTLEKYDGHDYTRGIDPRVMICRKYRQEAIANARDEDYTLPNKERLTRTYMSVMKKLEEDPDFFYKERDLRSRIVFSTIELNFRKKKEKVKNIGINIFYSAGDTFIYFLNFLNFLYYIFIKNGI